MPTVGTALYIYTYWDKKDKMRWWSAMLILIADIYISISMETFEHRKYKIRGENGNN